MKTQIGIGVLVFLFAVGVSAGAFVALYGTDPRAQGWTTQRTLELVLGLAAMGASGWWLVDRSSWPQ